MNDSSGWVATRLLLEMGRITRDNLSRDEALNKIAHLILNSFEVASVAVLVRDLTSNAVYVSSSVALSEDDLLVPPDITLRCSDQSCLRKALTNPDMPLALDCPTDDPVLGPMKGPSMIVPMKFGNEVTGFVLLGRSQFPARSVSDELLMAVAAQAGIIAAKASLMENLRQSEERYQSLMENARDLVFLLDRGGRFLYVNRACSGIFGCSPGEVQGRYFGEFVTPESWAKTIAAVKGAASRNEKHIEYSWEIQNGDSCTVLEVRASLLYQEGELLMHQGIARDLSHEKKLQEEIVRRDQELDRSKGREEKMREYLAVANLAQEEERARIAREIHDGALQYLIALGRRLDLLEKSLATAFHSPSMADLSFEDVHSLLDTAVVDLREFARNLRPPVLDDFGLVSACEWLADQTEKEGITTRFSVRGPVCKLPRDVENSVFRIAQEAISNAIKHSGATTVDFIMEFTDKSLMLTLRDNGKGFEPPESPGALVRAGQMGLIGMFERAELLSASVRLESSPGCGTGLRVEIPIQTA